MKNPFNIIEKIIDGPEGPTVILGFAEEGNDFPIFEAETAKKETFFLKPLEGIEWNGKRIPFGTSEKEVKRILGEPDVVKKSFYYFENELRLDFDKKGNLEFIEFVGGKEGSLNPVIYDISTFESEADEVEKLLRQKNGGDIDDSEQEYSCSFWNISVGVYRDITPADVLEMMEEMKADGISVEDNEDLENDKRRANHWATIGIGIADYYRK